jgi:hypothetical protein
MGKFMLLYTAPVSAEQQMANASPAEMEAGMKPWMEWFGKLGPALVDGGAPLGHGTSVSPQGSSPSSLHVGGYSIIEAADLSAAKSMVDSHPHFMMPGATVEILEVMPMPGM